MTLSWIDLALVAILLISVIVGVWRGLVFELMSLAGWVVAYLGAPYLAPWTLRWLPAERFGPELSHMLSVVIGFVLILLLWSLAARLVKTLIQASPLSPLDRLAGAGFGALRGMLIAVLAVFIAGFTPLAKSATWQASQIAPRLQVLMQDLKPWLPDAVAGVLPEAAEAAPPESQ
jgi:membrane protein required for colicin V production